MGDGRRRRAGAHLALLIATSRQAVPVVVPAVAVLGIAGAWRALAPGMVEWDVTGDALLDSVRASGPVAAGLAAWLAVTTERSGLGRLEQLGRRSAAAGPLTRLCVTASAALAGYALTAGAVAAWLGRRGTIAGSWQAPEVAAGAAALLVHVTAGFLVALLCCRLGRPAYAAGVRPARPPAPPRPAPTRAAPTRAPGTRPASAPFLVAPFLVARFLVAQFLVAPFLVARLRTGAPRMRLRSGRLLPWHRFGSAATAALPVTVLAASLALDECAGGGWHAGAFGWPALLLSPDVHHSPFAEWRPGLFIAAATWSCGLAAASVIATGWALTRSHRYAVAFAAASVVAGVGLGELRADAAHPVTAVSAESSVCRTWPLDVCVNPAFASALPQLESVFMAIAEQVSGTRAAIRSVAQLPPGTYVAPHGGGYGFHLEDLRQGYALRAESELTRQVARALGLVPPRRQATTVDIDDWVPAARSRPVRPVCRRDVPYAVEDGLELADMCAQGAYHLRPGRAQPP